jgi:alpha-mannosidase
LEAPYIEIGELKDTWDNDDVGQTSRINSLVMTNRWHCNYRAYQQGYAKFRYSIVPHNSYNSVFSTKTAVEVSQPLINAPVATSAKKVPLLRLSNDNVIATAFKRTDYGSSYLLRLWNPTDKPEMCNIDWIDKQSKMWSSDFTEEKGDELQLPFELLPKEIRTILIDGCL